MDRRWPKGLFKDRAAEFLKLYPGDTDAQALRSAVDFGSDQFIAFGTWKWLEAHRKTGDVTGLPVSLRTGGTAEQVSSRDVSLSTPMTSSMCLGRWIRGPDETVRPEDTTTERSDDDVLDELREERRSQWSGSAELAEVRHDGQFTDSPEQPDHVGTGRDAGPVFVPVAGHSGDAVLVFERHPPSLWELCPQGLGTPAPPTRLCEEVSCFHGGTGGSSLQSILMAGLSRRLFS